MGGTTRWRQVRRISPAGHAQRDLRPLTRRCVQGTLHATKARERPLLLALCTEVRDPPHQARRWEGVTEPDFTADADEPGAEETALNPLLLRARRGLAVHSTVTGCVCVLIIAL